jgi:hypothetical protein
MRCVVVFRPHCGEILETSVPPYRLIDLKDSATYCHVVKLNATVLDLSRYTDVRQTCPVFGTSEDLVHVIDTSSNELLHRPQDLAKICAQVRRGASGVAVPDRRAGEH